MRVHTMVLDLLWKFFAGPVIADALQQPTATWNGITAAAGYNIVNEIGYALILLGALYALVRLLQSWEVGKGKEFIGALLPWIVAWSALRVVEDAGFVAFPLNILLVTPVIFFVALGGTIAALGISYWIAQNASFSYTRPLFWSGVGMSGIVLALLLAGGSLDIGIAGGMLALTTFVFLLTEGLLRAGEQEWRMFGRFRRNDFRAAIFGHLLDGSATAIALSTLAYSEKHPVVDFFVEHIGSAYWFIPLKLAIILLVLSLLDESFEQERPLFFNLFLVAVIAVGMGPGIRNLLRASLGI